MTPDSAKRWLAVAARAVAIGLGVFVVVYELVWGAPPQAATIAAGVVLVVGGSASKKLWNGNGE